MPEPPSLGSTSIDRSLEDVARARRWTVDVVDGVDGLDPARLADVVLGVSELVTNALEHTTSAPTLEVRADEALLVVEVTDEDPSEVAVRPVNSSRPGGRGLRIVEAISDEWGTRYRSGGHKTVWFSISLGSSPPRR